MPNGKSRAKRSGMHFAASLGPEEQNINCRAASVGLQHIPAQMCVLAISKVCTDAC